MELRWSPADDDDDDDDKVLYSTLLMLFPPVGLYNPSIALPISLQRKIIASKSENSRVNEHIQVYESFARI